MENLIFQKAVDMSMLQQGLSMASVNQSIRSLLNLREF